MATSSSMLDKGASAEILSVGEVDQLARKETACR